MKSKDKLKKKLHELIDSIDDEDLLKMLNEDIVPYIINNRGAEIDADDDLSKEEQKKLRQQLKKRTEEKRFLIRSLKRQWQNGLQDKAYQNFS